MASKKKLLTSVVALGTAAALALGGTFAWQSINQTVLNEASDIVNPGGRLHNDQNWVSDRENNTNIYVENFTDPDANGETIFARVRLSEYMEIVMNYGVEGAEVVETVAGKKFDTDGNEVTDKATAKDTYTYEYAIHYFERDAEGSEEKNAASDFFKWTAGAQDSERPYYIPTYNVNKDSLLADLNGTYVDSVGGISNRGEEQYDYKAIDGESGKSGYEVYDGDVNTADEVGRADLLDLIENGTADENYATYAENIVLTDEKVEHTAKQVGETRGLISMEDWLALTENTDRYWVYDTDGWIYWSSPIAAGETTGLLLDGFTLNQVMDDTWYYAINVESQFVTADDVGKEDGTGFYDTVNGTAPSENAEKLLEIIGVGQEEDNSPVLKMHSSSDYNSTGYIKATTGEAFRLQTSSGNTPSGENMNVFTHGGSNWLDADTDYTYEDGFLTIKVDSASKDYLNSYGSYLLVQAEGCTGAILLEDDGALTLDYDSDTETTLSTPDCTLAAVGQGVTIKNLQGKAPETDDVALRFDGGSYDEGTEHYEYKDGVLTIKNADWVGKRVQVRTSDGCGWLIVTAGSASGGNESTGGGETEPDEGESHTLEGFLDTSTYADVVSSGKATFGFYSVEYDGTEIDSSMMGNLTAEVYKKGETETPVFTASGDDFYEEYYLTCMFDMPMSLVPAGSTEFDIYLRYRDDNGDETTSNKMSATYTKNVITLKADGYTSDLSALTGMGVFELDGVEDPWKDLTPSEITNNMTVVFPGGTECALVQQSDFPNQYDIKGSHSKGIIVVDQADGSDAVTAVRVVTLYDYDEGITFKLTLNGTEYSVTFTPAET